MPDSPTSPCKADWFTSELFSATLELTEDNVALMEEAAYVFILTGLPWEKYVTLSEVSRRAWVAAGRRVKIEAVMVALEAVKEKEKEPVPDA